MAEALTPRGVLVVVEAVDSYRTALENLSHQEAPYSEASVISVLMARNSVANALANHEPLTADLLSCLTALDRELRTKASAIDAGVGRATLASWREALQPPACAWWWALDELAAAADAKPNAFQLILGGTFIAISLSLTVEMSHRFLGGGPDFLSILSTFAQATLALLAGSSFTQFGRERLERVFSRLGIERKFQARWSMWLALAVLVGVLAFRLSLPAIARFYDQRGVHLLENKQGTTAIESFQRALSLNPDFAPAHYNLGNAYEELMEYDKAISEYQRAIETKDIYYPAYNNLARLMIGRGDYGRALMLLDRGIALNPPEEVKYSLYKNRGWANFGLKCFGEAEDDLQTALKRNHEGAAAHCILAQVLNARNKEREAVEEWKWCLAYAPGEQGVEASWQSLARERLRSDRTK